MTEFGDTIMISPGMGKTVYRSNTVQSQSIPQEYFKALDLRLAELNANFKLLMLEIDRKEFKTHVTVECPGFGEIKEQMLTMSQNCQAIAASLVLLPPPVVNNTPSIESKVALDLKIKWPWQFTASQILLHLVTISLMYWLFAQLANL